MAERRKLPREDKPTPIRIPPALMARIKIAADRLGYSVAETIRLSVGVGLERLRRIDYDIDSSINDAAERQADSQSILRAAEEPAPYGGKKTAPGHP